MPTAKQTAANRMNSQKSTGPRTTEGKAASRCNAVKHGIFATTQIMFDESAEDLAELAAEYHEHHSPADANQRFLVDTLVNNEWRLRRLRRGEAELWEHATNTFLAENIEVPACSSGDAFATAAPTFERLQRIVNSCERAYHRALKELQQGARAHGLRSREPEAEPAAAPPTEAGPAPPPQPEQPKPSSAKMGSVRQNPITPPPAAPKPPDDAPAAPPFACPATPAPAKTLPRPADRFPDPMEAIDAALRAISKKSPTDLYLIDATFRRRRSSADAPKMSARGNTGKKTGEDRGLPLPHWRKMIYNSPVCSICRRFSSKAPPRLKAYVSLRRTRP